MRVKAPMMVCVALVLWQLIQVTDAAQSSWTYKTESDAMTGGTIKIAYTRSTNTVSFGFPYSGAQRASLVLRRHPRHGQDVFMNIERGQFLCSSFDECTLLARFDGGNPTTWNAVEPEDHSTTTLFLEDADAFVVRLRTARTVRMAAKFFQEGEKVFIFNVAGLVW